jgi:hypothetical protein
MSTLNYIIDAVLKILFIIHKHPPVRRHKTYEVKKTRLKTTLITVISSHQGLGVPRDPCP